jgi:hypothetical protein
VARCDFLHSTCDNNKFSGCNWWALPLPRAAVFHLWHYLTHSTSGYTGAQCRTPPGCENKCLNGADLLPAVAGGDGANCGQCQW